MAADGYARSTGFLGLAIATSGPGATNLLTGIAGAWFDSIPCIFISGQVATFRMKNSMKIRQLGFQETDIVAMARPITKLAVQIKTVSRLEEVLKISINMALSGRPGPVLIDIPDDLQRSHAHFNPPSKVMNQKLSNNSLSYIKQFKKIENLLRNSKRPLIILGAGANTQVTRKLSQKLIRTLNIPVLTTWGAKDLIPYNDTKLIGTFGSHGTRHGNFAVQNSDLIIVLGSRLSSREIGGDLQTWARVAKIVHVDIDKTESDKFKFLGRALDLKINSNLSDFIPQFIDFSEKYLANCTYPEWFEWIDIRKKKYRYETSGNVHELDGYDFYLILNDFLRENDQIFLDTGCTVAWAMQSLSLPAGSRTYHDFNNTAMGWALPAAIGGALSSPLKRTIVISGDGSIMMNIQELATAMRYVPNLKIIVLNNSGYGMVRQTEDQWLNGVNVGTSSKIGDIQFPNFTSLAKSFGYKVGKATSRMELKMHLKSLFLDNSIGFLEVEINKDAKVIPQTRFGYPLEDSEPELPKEELIENMIIPVLRE
jgi:acetolactate synthase-1/2/3 large subunit